MPNQPTRQELQRLLDDLLRLDRDTEWAAFHAEPDWKALGPMIAGLANAAALNENPCGYLLCGVNAVTRTVDADVAHFFRAEIQTREFETELLQRLTPRLAPQAYWLDTKDGAPVLLIEVPAADSVPSDSKEKTGSGSAPAPSGSQTFRKKSVSCGGPSKRSPLRRSPRPPPYRPTRYSTASPYPPTCGTWFVPAPRRRRRFSSAWRPTAFS